MLEGMDGTSNGMRMLVIDTCGEAAGLALSEGERVVGQCMLPSRSASAAIVSALGDLLKQCGRPLPELDGIGVVAGPGSFTGVRTGLAAAKGLCEATGLPIATVSRLDVLARAASLREGYAVLGAGRRDLYVLELRDGAASESMSTVEVLLERAAGSDVVAAEEMVLELLRPLQPRLHKLTVADAVPLLLAALQRGGIDSAAADANYVRRESELYAKQGSAPSCATP
jgi:tRNA threonylcarbamoyladenosine biosynthesis protein TsaB